MHNVCIKPYQCIISAHINLTVVLSHQLSSPGLAATLAWQAWPPGSGLLRMVQLIGLDHVQGSDISAYFFILKKLANIFIFKQGEKIVTED